MILLTYITSEVSQFTMKSLCKIVHRAAANALQSLFCRWIEHLPYYPLLTPSSPPRQQQQQQLVNNPPFMLPFI